MLEEKLLRFAAPALYERMAETLSANHIHPYDVQAAVRTNGNGLDVFLTFSADLSQSATHHFSFEQAAQPDEEVTIFFRKVADQCRSLLIADYYKMMKL